MNWRESLPERNVGTLLLLLLLATIVLQGGCSKSGNGEEGRFRDENKKFTITGPKNWEEKVGLSITAVAFLSPVEGPGDSFGENINVVVEGLLSASSLDEYVQANVFNMKKMLTGLQIVANSRRNVNGLDAERMVYTHRMEAMDLKVLSYMFIKGERGYVITCTATPDTYDKYEREFEKTCQSMRID